MDVWCLIPVQVVVLVCLFELHIGFGFWLYCVLSSVNWFDAALLKQSSPWKFVSILYENYAVIVVGIQGLGFKL